MIVRDSLQGLWRCAECDEWDGFPLYIEVAGPVVTFAVDVQRLEGVHGVPRVEVVNLNDQRIWWGTTRKSGFPSVLLEVTNFRGETHAWHVGIVGESHWKHEWRCEAHVEGGGVYTLDPVAGSIASLGGQLLQAHTACDPVLLLGEWHMQDPATMESTFGFSRLSITDEAVKVWADQAWVDVSAARTAQGVQFTRDGRRFRMACSLNQSGRYAWVAAGVPRGSLCSHPGGDGVSPPGSPLSRAATAFESCRCAVFALQTERQLSFVRDRPIPAPPREVARLNPRVHQIRGLGGVLVKKPSPPADAATDATAAPAGGGGMEHIFGKPKPPPVPEPPLTGRARKLRLKEQGFTVSATPVRIPDIYASTNTALGVVNAYKGPQKRAYKMTRSELPKVHRIMRSTQRQQK